MLSFPTDERFSPVAHIASKLATSFALTLSVAAGAAFAQTSEQRELGAHQHGRGSLQLAIEKDRVVMELEAPGVDIVGFEHAPKTQAERDAVEAAKRRLADPLALFGLPKAAGCKVIEANVELEDGHQHEAGAKDDHKHDHKHGEADKHGGHTDFQAMYILECKEMKALTTLEFTYFEAFAGAASLEIVAVSDKGQIKAEATRKAPKVALQGLM